MKSLFNLNKLELENILENRLKEEYIGTLYENRKVQDIQIQIFENDWCYGNQGGTHHEIEIYALVSSLKGYSQKWVKVY